MKNRVVPRDEERRLGEEDFIVSRTDLKGRITYCNRIFMRISGYREAELLGRQQNIVRHPDMPRGMFKLVWDNLQEGREVFAYIKNLSKDGSFYWVFANITADRDQAGNITGYYSVRRYPSETALAVIEPLYREMQAIEQRHPARDQMTQSLAYLRHSLEERGTSYEKFVLAV